MNLTIPRHELKEAIASLSKLINKPTLQILSAVKISAFSTGLRVTASNLTEHLSFHIKGNSDEANTSFVVSLPELKEYVDATKSAEIYKLRTDYKGEARISTDIEEHPEKPLLTFPEKDFPEEPDKAKLTTNLISKNSLKAIQSAIPSVAVKESARAPLKCILIEENAVIASNGIELVRLECDTGLKEQTLLPVTKFLSSATFTDRDSSIGILEFNSHKYLSVSNERFEYLTKLSAETYPNYRNVIPASNPYGYSISNKDVDKLLKELPFLEYTSDNKAVHISFEKDKLRIFSENFKQSIEIPTASGEGSKQVIKTFRRHLLLRAFSLGFNKFSLNEGITPVIASSEGSSILVFMPLHSNQEIINQIALSQTQELDTKSTTKEEPKMETATFPKPVSSTNYVPTFQGATEVKTDIMEELINKITSVRNKAREVIDISIDVTNQLRNMQKSQKAKEREFKSANELLEKLKKVSGF